MSHLFKQTLGIVALLCLVGVTGQVGYWKFIQPDPRIEPRRQPVPNAGIDINGVRLAQAEGRPVILTPNGWQAKPKTEWRAGETMWVARDDCFFNKIAGPVQRAFIGDDGSVYTLPLIYPPKTTPSGQCSAANFAVPLPADLKPQSYTYAASVIFYKNPMDREVITRFADVRFTIVE